MTAYLLPVPDNDLDVACETVTGRGGMNPYLQNSAGGQVSLYTQHHNCVMDLTWLWWVFTFCCPVFAAGGCGIRVLHDGMAAEGVERSGSTGQASFFLYH
jgi:hypothetical protein